MQTNCLTISERGGVHIRPKSSIVRHFSFSAQSESVSHFLKRRGKHQHLSSLSPQVIPATVTQSYEDEQSEVDEHRSPSFASPWESAFFVDGFEVSVRGEGDPRIRAKRMEREKTESSERYMTGCAGSQSGRRGTVGG